MPTYLAAIDVALIPFKQDPVTYHADPIKAYEYLAAGVPIVATDLPALRRLEHVVRLADSPESFLSQIEAAVREGRAARNARPRPPGTVGRIASVSSTVCWRRCWRTRRGPRASDPDLRASRAHGRRARARARPGP